MLRGWLPVATLRSTRPVRASTLLTVPEALLVT